MSPDKERELIAICPSLFSDLSDKSCMALFGFECHDGWYSLLKNLIEEIRDIIKRDDLKDLKVSQIKEKYGTLRFYLCYETSAIDECVRRAEERSSTVCEYCGSEEGELRRDGWYKTLCDPCANHRKEHGSRWITRGNEPSLG